MHFIKYHGLGNDFIVLMASSPPRKSDDAPLDASVVSRLCARGAGVGADGVIVARPSIDATVAMEIYNRDGSQPEMCGNGIRCLVKYAVEVLGCVAQPLIVETGAGLLRCGYELDASGHVSHVSVDMGKISFLRSRVPMLPASDGALDAVDIPLQVQDRVFRVTGVNVGNPHMVIFGDSGRGLAERWGPVLTHHEEWVDGTNVEFARIVSPQEIHLTVWERGCGLTQACGTGATATAAAAVRLGHCDAGAPIAVHLPGGLLHITVSSQCDSAEMRGPAVEVFRGQMT